MKNWSAYDPALGRTILQDVNFNVKKGEIVGFAGLMGSGRTELALSLFGNPKGYKINGEVYVKGKKVHFNHPQEAIRAGHRLCDRRPESRRADPDPGCQAEHHAGESAEDREQRRRRQQRRDQGRRRVPEVAQYQDAEHRAEGGQPERRQPAEGLGGEVAVRQARTC